MHCVECANNLGPACANAHRRMKVSAGHQQVPLGEVLTGRSEIMRVPRCQKHIGMEIDTFCTTCDEAVCAKCLSEKHSGHTFCPLSQVAGSLKEKIAGYSVTITKREEEAIKAVDTLDGTINNIEEHRSTAEKDIATLFAAMHVTVDARHAQVLQQMQDKGNQLRKTAIQEKGEAESAIVEFREFHPFAVGLRTQGTPLEITGTHKMVKSFTVSLLPRW